MKLRIHQITWNVAYTHPLKDELYESLFCLDKNLNYKYGDYPDFYVISTQEQSIGVLENNWKVCFKSLFKQLRDTKGVFYIKLQSNSIFYLNQYVFVTKKLLQTCKMLDTIKITNYAGVTGKGTIAFKFKMNNDSFTFLSSHLAAHDYGNPERIAHYKRLINEDTFYDHTRILNCSFSFLAGDLNSRLVNLDLVELINDLNAKGTDLKFLENLQNYDQLRTAQREGDAFQHFQEDRIRFKPTFKYHPNTQYYNPKRTPSWCDRILYRVNHSKASKKCNQLAYESVEEYTQSDHRPVIAVFDLETDVRPISNLSSNVSILSTGKTDVDNKLDIWVNKKLKEDEFKFNLLLSAKQDYSESSTDGAKDRKAGWDWIGLFHEDFDDLDDYLAYLYVEDVPNYEEPPEEIVMKMCSIEKAEEAFEVEQAKELKEGELIESQPCSSKESLKLGETSRPKEEAKFEALRKRLEWSKLEFAEQTFTEPGRYVLIYFNGDRSVEYISEPFEVTTN